MGKKFIEYLELHDNEEHKQASNFPWQLKHLGGKFGRQGEWRCRWMGKATIITTAQQQQNQEALHMLFKMTGHEMRNCVIVF